MSLQPITKYSVPHETARVAHAIFPKGNIYLTLAEELKTFLVDEDFADLYPNKGQPAESPLRLALATILQYTEGLTDRQTADAVRSRIDWKYLLCLELTDSGFHHTVLSEFRTRLIAGGASALIFEKLLKLCQEKGWLKSQMRQRTDSTHVLGAIRAVTRLECVGETLRAALNTLAVVAPDWLLSNADEEWVKRYNTRIEDYHQPKSKSKREELANIYGEDGLKLLNAVFETSSPDWLRKIPAVEMLRRVWVQQYYLGDDRIRWRTAQEIPPASFMISSPYDPDARYAKKHTTSWVGYKVHLTETCESNQPHLITHVETTPAPITDDQVTQPIHEALKSQDLLPNKHIVDTGYLDAELLAQTQEQYSLELIGPTRNDYHWQSLEGKGFAAANFSVDWNKQSVTCPEGKISSSWSTAVDKWGNEVVKIKFASQDCSVCPSLHFCTRSKTKRRTLTLRTQLHHQALQAARQRETTTEFKEEYARRAGIEGTMSEGVRVHHLRRTRYIGLAKTHLQHLMTAVAINLKRLFNWLSGIPLATTRISRWEQLMTNPATSQG